MKDLTVNVRPDGSLLFVCHDELEDLLGLHVGRGPAAKRASHVEPDPDTTRGNWTVDLSPVGGPFLTGFWKRKDALAAEVAWIDEHVMGEEVADE
jgi:hypothetical protein